MERPLAMGAPSGVWVISALAPPAAARPAPISDTPVRKSRFLMSMFSPLFCGSLSFREGTEKLIHTLRCSTKRPQNLFQRQGRALHGLRIAPAYHQLRAERVRRAL